MNECRHCGAAIANGNCCLRCAVRPVDTAIVVCDFSPEIPDESVQGRSGELTMRGEFCQHCQTPLIWDYTKCRCARFMDNCDYCSRINFHETCDACFGVVPQTEQGIRHAEYIDQRSEGVDAE